MQQIYEISQRLVRNVPTLHHRYLYGEIDWNDRLIMIKGARGLGKTTMMLQRIKEAFPAQGKAVYASADNIWFNNHTLWELADFHYKNGGTHLFIDEVHRYPTDKWQQEIKNIYDSYPDLNIVFTGSSMLQLDSRVADLSRRLAEYYLRGLSFREFLNFNAACDHPLSAIPLQRLLTEHPHLSEDIFYSLREKGLFEWFANYLGHGYYPFFLDTSVVTYRDRVEKIVKAVIDQDLPAVVDVQFDTLAKIKKLLVILAEKVPFTLNITSLCKDLQISRNQLVKLFELLGQGAILRPLFNPSNQPKAAAKPDKLLFDNPDVMSALGAKPDIGTVRETFMASMLSANHRLFLAPKGDLLVDRHHTIEIGGPGKDFKQISGVPDSYIAADDTATGLGNRIPLWLFGFLY